MLLSKKHRAAVQLL